MTRVGTATRSAHAPFGSSPMTRVPFGGSAAVGRLGFDHARDVVTGSPAVDLPLQAPELTAVE